MSETEDRAFFGHPKGLAVLAFTEAWERFSFYGMQTMLMLYMVDQLLTPGHVEHVIGLGWLRGSIDAVGGALPDQAIASLIFGLYSGLAYFLPVFGGLIGDRWLGQHRMVTIGALLMATGHFLMAFEMSFLIALLLLIIGSGCLKGNISTQVGNLYAIGDRRRVDAFQIFLVGITSGVVLAPFVCGTLGEIYGWHVGFASAGVGMLIGLVIYLSGHRHLPPDRRAVREHRPSAPLNSAEWQRIAALFVVLLVVTVYLVPGGQSGIGYPLWIKAHVDRSAGAFVVPITWFQSFTAIASIAVPPVLIRLWRWQAKRGREPDDVTKLAIGSAFSVAAYCWLAGVAWLNPDVRVSWLWLLPHHVLFSFGYLFVWPVGMALFTRAAPPAVSAMFIGIYFLSLFLANNIAGVIGRYYGELAPDRFWAVNAAIVGGGCVILLVLGRPLRRLLVTRGPRQEATAT